MVKHTQIIRQQQLEYCLSVLDDFVGLARNRLKIIVPCLEFHSFNILLKKLLYLFPNFLESVVLCTFQNNFFRIIAHFNVSMWRVVSEIGVRQVNYYEFVSWLQLSPIQLLCENSDTFKSIIFSCYLFLAHMEGSLRYVLFVINNKNCP